MAEQRADSPGVAGLWLWRHPRAQGAAGRCIGRTDLPVDRRRAKRLAHRIRRTARQQGLPRVVWTSPLQRCADVGRWLARWGWQHRTDARLLELDFGRWDGQPWTAIAHADVAAWEADFAHHAPGGGEALAALVARCRQFIAEQGGATPLLLVAHAGWMQASGLGSADGLRASAWPPAPRHGALLRRSGP
ncbi:histidine phosphatase family protein [Pseudaquabacterium pictum]|uniref:Phosphoglycerate mutase n=1 Tax=Pseudaquabacterium pictum TaxID=2315236 RepID=A0A480AIU4_9BURK|nr:histidine phosphatase family protein [Rubrivivax pictus]GCL61383.1 hypothetical protein AQPW35_04640 [Rubrivivax pictus]